MPRTAAFLSVLGGAATGAGLMYWLDPSQGRRRRHLLQQKATHVATRGLHAADVTARDLAHRFRGLTLEALGRMAPERVEDDVLASRVRSHLGRLTTHPGAIHVRCHDGAVELTGQVLEREINRVLRGTRRVRGVGEVRSQLQVFNEPGHVPSLQGEHFAPRWGHGRWSPTMRLGAGLWGASLLAYGYRRRGAAGIGAGAVGLALVVRAATNLELRRVFGVAPGPEGILVQKALTIHAPVEEVFAYFHAFENWPRFMEHVREVRRGEGELWHWIISGPAGIPLEWDAELVRSLENRLIEWRSLPGSTVQSTGTVLFEPDEHGGTRLQVRLAYRPPAGAVGHVIAKLLGADPKKQLDDDLLRLKSLLERGKATGHEGTTTREELGPLVH